MEDWTCLGQHKRQPEFPVVTRESRRNSRKTTWLPRHRKMKPFPATAPQEKSHLRNWSSKRYLSPLMRPTKCPDIPVSLERNTEVFRQHFLGAPSTLLIWTGGSTPLLCLEGVPDLPVAPQDEAGLTTTFQTVRPPRRQPVQCGPHRREVCRLRHDRRRSRRSHVLGVVMPSRPDLRELAANVKEAF